MIFRCKTCMRDGGINDGDVVTYTWILCAGQVGISGVRLRERGREVE